MIDRIPENIKCISTFSIGFDHIDLDSHLNLARDPTSGLRVEAGQLVAPNRPGLGIAVDLSSVT